jgi:Zn-dependent protease with chaperone function
MGLWVRTLAGVLLLAVFPFALVLLLAGMVTLQVVLFVHSIGTGVKWLIIVVPFSMVMLRALAALTGPIDIPTSGVPLTKGKQRDLWTLVRQLAEVAGTQPPNEIYLTAEANASVVEETRMLGLVSTRRIMFIGAPLVVTLRTDQLAAILTHELAHYGGHHTRLAAMSYRGRRALTSAVSSLDADYIQRLLRRLLKAWTKLYLRASSGLSKRQEREADKAAARAAGSAAAASALREIAPTDMSWDLFTQNHLVMGWPAGYLPADPFGGYEALRASLADRLDELRGNPPAGQVIRYDTHPPMAERVAALEAMAAAPVIELDDGPATELLREPRKALDAALASALVKKAKRMRRASWDTLAAVHGMAEAASVGVPLLERAGQPATVGSLLSALDAGRITELCDVPAAAGVGPRGRRVLAGPAVLAGLLAVVQGALAEVGAGHWERDWPSGGRFVTELGLGPSLEAAVADPPDTAGLRGLLTAAGVDLDTPLTWRMDVRAHQVVLQPEAPGGGPLPR